MGSSAGVRQGTNSLSLPLNINTAVTTWNTVSFPVIGPIQQAGWSQLLSTSLPALSKAALGSGSKPLASNQVTPAGCTDGAAGQNFYKDMCPRQLEGAPRLKRWTLDQSSYLVESSNGSWMLGIQANSLGRPWSAGAS